MNSGSPPLMESARARLGTTIRFYVEKRGWPIRRVSDVTSTPIGTIDAWYRGDAVPDARAWKSLKMAINHTLGDYADLYHRACVEQESHDSAKRADKEQRKMEQKQQHISNGHRATVSTSLGAKLVDALIDNPTPIRAPIVLATTPTSSRPAADRPPPRNPTHFAGGPGDPIKPVSVPPYVHREPPAQRAEIPAIGWTNPATGEPLTRPAGTAKDGRKLVPKRPPNTMTSEAIEQRKEWARAQFRIRPAIRMHGDDGILALMRNRFGVGLNPDTLAKLKAEVHAEINRAPGAPPPGFTPKPDPTPEHTERQAIPVIEPTERIHVPNASDNIATAVSLLLETIPNLKTFTITVDEHGEASCDYTERKVQIVETSGSLKVRK